MANRKIKLTAEELYGTEECIIEKDNILKSGADNWNPSTTFSEVPEMLMPTVIHLSQYIHFSDMPSSTTVTFTSPDICHLNEVQLATILKHKYCPNMKNHIEHKCDFNNNLYLCKAFHNNEEILCPSNCPSKSIIFPTLFCPIILAAYYKYLLLINPTEFKKQRNSYLRKKDEVDGTIAKYFSFYNPYKENPLLTSKRINEVRHEIDNGNIILFEDKVLTCKRFDTYKNKTEFKNSEEYFGAKYEKSKDQMLKNYIFHSLKFSPTFTSTSEEEAALQILFLLKLLSDGEYTDYYKKVKEKEKNTPRLSGNYYRGIISSDNKEERLKALKEKEFQIRYSYNIPRIAGAKYDTTQLALELSGRRQFDEINGKTKELKTDTLYILENLQYFCDLYEKSKDDINKHTIFKHLINQIIDLSQNTFILLYGNQSEIDNFLRLDEKLKVLFEKDKTVISDYNLDEILKQYFTLLKLRQPSGMPSSKNKTVLKNFLTENINILPLKNQDLINYLLDNTDKNGQVNLKAPLLNTHNKNFDAEINKLTGLVTIKTQLQDFYNLIKFRRIASESNLSIEKSNMHMIFDGPPGTGKTTVARLIAKALYDIGVTKTNKIVECERKDLIAEYVGQTAMKTFEKIQEARGGVLFIDEAYSLAGSNKDFGFEAIATLITAMEDYKDDLVVIFAGYTKEMQEFIEANSGIKSRIGYNFHFDAYSEDELSEMLTTKLLDSGFSVEEDFSSLFKELFIPYLKDENFGNGRFVMKIYQMIIQNMANRISKDSSSDFKTVLKSDIPTKNDILKITPNQKISLGFI